jgi:hypothetical protein
MTDLGVVPVVAAVVGFAAVWVLYICLFKTSVSHFYPSGLDILHIYIKLVFSPLYKQMGWVRQVKPGLKLSKDFKFTLPLKIDIQVRGCV